MTVNRAYQPKSCLRRSTATHPRPDLQQAAMADFGASHMVLYATGLTLFERDHGETGEKVDRVVGEGARAVAHVDLVEDASVSPGNKAQRRSHT